MKFIDKIKEQAKKDIKTIILPETEDIRVLKGAEIVLKEKTANIILIGNENEINKLSKENNINIEGAKIVNPESCDKFEEYEAVLEKAEKAVRGKTLQKDGELVCTTYFAISSGNTDAGGDIWGGDDACLQPAASPGDIFADGYLSQAEMTVNEVKEALARLCPEEKLGNDPDAWMAKLERTGSGTVRSGMVGNTQVTGTELRNAFGLRSANFTFEIEKGKFLFTVRGWGHNVGMSQNGAQYMAQNGADYQEILAWYYPGSELV